MEYTDVIEKLCALPPEKQSEVSDFIEFLALRNTWEKITLPISCLKATATQPGLENGEKETDARNGVRPPRVRMNDHDLRRIVHEAHGAWGNRTLEETEALIKQRRLEDWGACASNTAV